MAERTRVLVVEDDPDIRELLVMVLGQLDLDVHQASSGTQALEMAREIEPALVTLDLGLPDIDGLETCRRLREFSDAYVLMLTARDERTDRDVGLESGADAFMAKPFSPKALRTRVAEVLAARADGAATDG
ncbi:response regulator transcription factor [Nocardioides alkalitolerans]|uniref:response regulator transcription factor n=1 Tax=Nocardioides alkalitolerans TaxID=281714 RepID=UPI0004103285|nr:response regulator [Nocardioides alkalitolerans]